MAGVSAHSDEGCMAPAGAWKRQRGAFVRGNKQDSCGKEEAGLNFALCVLLGQSFSQSIHTACVVFYCKKRRGQLEYYATRADNNWEQHWLWGNTRPRHAIARVQSATFSTRIISKARHTLVSIHPGTVLSCDSTRISRETMKPLWLFNQLD